MDNIPCLKFGEPKIRFRHLEVLNIRKMILFSFPNEIQNKEVQEISDFPPWWPHWVFKEILNIKYFKINCSCFLVPIFLELPKLLRVNTAICLDPIHLLTSKVLSCISTTLYWVTFSSLKTCCNILKEKKLPWPHIPFMQFLCYSSPLYNTQNIIYKFTPEKEFY